MSDFSKIITQKNVKQIWRRLLDSIVPIVGDDDLKEIKKYVDNITNELSENKYIPDVGHGYLGYPKSNGCTRFVPIISKEDMAVYYLIVLSLQKYLISPIEGVYGAWRVVPEKIKVAFEEAEEDSIIDPYYSETLSNKAWFKN